MRLLQATPVRPSPVGRARTRTMSVFKAVDSKDGTKAPEMNLSMAAVSKAQRGTPIRERGLSCHHHAAMTVWSMRSGILPPIQCSQA